MLLLLAFIFALFGQLENISMQTFGRRLVGQTAGATENPKRWCARGWYWLAFPGVGGDGGTVTRHNGVVIILALKRINTLQ